MLVGCVGAGEGDEARLLTRSRHEQRGNDGRPPGRIYFYERRPIGNAPRIRGTEEGSVRGLAFVLVAVALLAGSIPAPVGASHVGGLYGGDVRVALPAAPSLDPLQFEANRIVQELVYESLTRLGPDQLPVPSLAVSWTVDSGAGTITFDLRGAVWADGAAVTAQDVAWSFGKHLFGGTASGFTVAVVDADTVRFTITS